jgi:hypothetical protein
MRKIIVLTFMFLFNISKGQDTIRRFEFGSTLATVNSFNTNYYFAPDRPSIEYLNGLFFRYTRNGFGLRLHASYTNNSISYAAPIGWSDNSSGDIKNKDIRIGFGGQISLLKHKEWFYTFLDLSYRNVFSTGHNYGGITVSNDEFSRRSNGFDTFFGLGFKIKTVRHVYLSPELGYYCSTKFVNQTTTPIYLGQSSKSNYTEVNLNPVIKLHLTLKF